MPGGGGGNVSLAGGGEGGGGKGGGGKGGGGLGLQRRHDGGRVVTRGVCQWRLHVAGAQAASERTWLGVGWVGEGRAAAGWGWVGAAMAEGERGGWGLSGAEAKVGVARGEAASSMPQGGCRKARACSGAAAAAAAVGAIGQVREGWVLGSQTGRGAAVMHVWCMCL